MSANAKRRALVACMAIGTAALCVPVVADFPVSIVYNASDSLPRGWYRIRLLEHAQSLHTGSIVLARLPGDAAALAAPRGYLSAGVPILKRIGAAAPQMVCVRDRLVCIDGVAAATIRTHDGALRSLPSWKQCRRLAKGELFLLGDANPASFDSRYFGPIDASAVIGVARPLWTWGSK